MRLTAGMRWLGWLLVGLALVASRFVLFSPGRVVSDTWYPLAYAARVGLPCVGLVVLYLCLGARIRSRMVGRHLIYVLALGYLLAAWLLISRRLLTLVVVGVGALLLLLAHAVVLMAIRRRQPQ